VNSSTDILIIGGGVIGLTTALKLAEQGRAVTVVDRQSVGREASWAGAGMLPPGNLSCASTPEARLRSYSHDMWEDLAALLKDRTGIDNGFRRCGAVELPTDDGLFGEQVQAWQAERLRVQTLDRIGLEQHVPGLHETFMEGVVLSDFGQVRNPRHMKALAVACRDRGVEIVEYVDGLRLAAGTDGFVTASTFDRTFAADRICVTAGSWTNQVLAPLSISLPVKPVRGQIALLKTNRLPFSCVVEQGRRYLVPRTDGLILVGATEEHVGFEKRTTADAISELLTFAASLVPELGKAEVVKCWAGLRPGSPDELPFLGRVPKFKNLLVGAGHFRSGLQMSPGTGALLADLLVDREPQISMDGLTYDRAVASTDL